MSVVPRKRKSYYQPKCYCTSTLVNGRCPYGCDPALRAPHAREHKTTKAINQQLQHARREQRIDIRIELVREAAARIVPALAEMAMRQEVRTQRRKARYGR